MIINVLQKLGRLKIVILITIASILVSVFITLFTFHVGLGEAASHIGIFLAIVIPSIVAPLASWQLIGLLMKIDRLEKEMRRLATIDPLTELLNRRAFFHDAEIYINCAKRELTNLSVIALDLDAFKHINDSYGHSTGDQVLTHFSATLKANSRKSDLICRLGGEEFALLLPSTSENEAYVLSERLPRLLGSRISNMNSH
ncbi:diguanylate cyclase [Shewanella halifaxensis HAW-EB4]|uniref:diguanylate cyclase n=1 Tax=Shewanella halifaxensis (strain HAW-EB4) TaxID=458817 RepID=B0TMM3_SHEHH|nr:diguanylate cyclase [Shewanella halifaxensis HAW-EB4]